MRSIPVEASLKCKALPEEPGELLLTCETLTLVSTEMMSFTIKPHKTQCADKSLQSLG